MAHCAERKDCRIFAGSDFFFSAEKLISVILEKITVACDTVKQTAMKY